MSDPTINAWHHQDELRAELRSIKQAITDPENQPSQYGTVTVEYMERAIAKAVADEREACAKVCEEPGWNAANWCAKQIRART